MNFILETMGTAYLICFCFLVPKSNMKYGISTSEINTFSHLRVNASDFLNPVVNNKAIAVCPTLILLDCFTLS